MSGRSLKWTPDELATLESSYREGGIEGAVSAFPYRTPKSVRLAIDRRCLNLSHLKPGDTVGKGKNMRTLRTCLACDRQFLSRTYHVCQDCREANEGINEINGQAPMGL